MFITHFQTGNIDFRLRNLCFKAGTPDRPPPSVPGSRLES